MLNNTMERERTADIYHSQEIAQSSRNDQLGGRVSRNNGSKSVFVFAEHVPTSSGKSNNFQEWISVEKEA